MKLFDKIFRCRRFDRDLGEWVSGRLPSGRSDWMAAHVDDCPGCAELARLERSLRGAWRSVAAESGATRTPDLWGRVEARLSAPAPRPRVNFSKGYAFGGALAAGLTLAVIVSRQPGVTPGGGGFPVARTVEAAQEARVVDLVADMRHMPEAYSSDGLTFGAVRSGGGAGDYDTDSVRKRDILVGTTGE